MKDGSSGESDDGDTWKQITLPIQARKRKRSNWSQKARAEVAGHTFSGSRIQGEQDGVRVGGS